MLEEFWSWCKDNHCIVFLGIIGAAFLSVLVYYFIRLFVLFPSMQIVHWSL